ncbi:hypothetical protein K8I28_09860 [bacterium]|nr:hypothetical protein [bacterium]
MTNFLVDNHLSFIKTPYRQSASSAATPFICDSLFSSDGLLQGGSEEPVF